MFKKVTELFTAVNRAMRRHGKAQPFNLQLFADDAGASGTSEDDKKGAEGTDDGTEDAGAEEGEETHKAEEAKYTDADLDKIISRKIAEERKKQQKAVDEAKRLANMTAEEKKQNELAETKQQLESLQRQIAIDKMAKVARGILAEKSISLPDELLSTLVTDDADQTKTNVTNFAKLFDKAVDAAVKERLKGKTPGTGTPASNLTRKDIENIKDRRERQQAIKDNINLFIGGK